MERGTCAQGCLVPTFRSDKNRAKLQKKCFARNIWHHKVVVNGHVWMWLIKCVEVYGSPPMLPFLALWWFFFKFLASCRSNLLLVEKVSKIYFKSFFMTFGRFCWRFLLVAKQRLGSFLVFSWIFRQNLLTLPINCCLLQFLPHQQSHKSRLWPTIIT